MCINSISAHRKVYKKTKGLDLKNLRGPRNSKRRLLKKHHTLQGGKCIWCEQDTYLWWEISPEEMKKIGYDRLATREHMIPKSAGGPNDMENIACACQECNTLRRDIPLSQFTWVSLCQKRFQKFKTRRLARMEEIRQIRERLRAERLQAHKERCEKAAEKRRAKEAAIAAAEAAKGFAIGSAFNAIEYNIEYNLSA